MDPAQEFTDDFLEHYGVKGMKWGVTNDKSSRAENKQAKKQAKFDKAKGDLVFTKTCKNGTELNVHERIPSKFEQRMAAKYPDVQKTAELSHAFLFADKNGARVGEASFYQSKPNTLDLEWIGVDKGQRSNGYARAALEGVVDYAKANNIESLDLYATKMGKPLYESMGFEHQGSSFYRMKINAEAKHGDAEAESLLDYIAAAIDRSPELNDAEEVTDEVGNDEVTQGEEFTDDFLEHYGVKGMKWGVRRDRAEKKAASEGKTLSFKRITPEPGTSKRAKRKAADKLDPSEDVQAFVRTSAKVGTKGNTKALSNNDLKLLNDRLRLEQEFTRLSGEGAPSRGRKMANEILGGAGKQQLNRVVNQQATIQVDNMMKKKARG